MKKSIYTKLCLLTLILMMLLACISEGTNSKLIGKYVRSENATNGGITVTTSYCIFVYQSETVQNGQTVKTQYEKIENINKCN